MKKLGDRLRDLREERNLKQKDVAAALDISNKVLSSYERNISQPSVDIFKRICEFYQVSADELLDLESDTWKERPEGLSKAVRYEVIVNLLDSSE